MDCLRSAAKETCLEYSAMELSFELLKKGKL